MASSNEQMQNDLLATIDAIMACIEQYPTFNEDTTLSDVGVSVNAITLLMNLIGKFYSVDEILDWLVDFLTENLPAIELAIKGVILSNLKLSISCNVDPWIPSIWRQSLYGEKDNGLGDPTKIPISRIDYRNMLQIIPTSKSGQQYYTKTKIEYTHDYNNNILARKTSSSYNEVYSWMKEQQKNSLIGFMFSEDNIKSTGDITSIYQLARADDMNAFLWFVGNKGLYGNITRESLSSRKENVVRDSTLSKNIGKTTLNINSIDDYSVYLSGDIVSTTSENRGIDSCNYLLCYDGQRVFTDKELTYHSKLIPCSSHMNSYNWYVNRKNYFNNLTAKSLKNERNYDDEFPLCNMACVDMLGNPSISSLDKFIQVKILPQPLLHYKDGFWLIENSQTPQPMPFMRVLFNEKGEQDGKGHFTVCPERDSEGKIKSKIVTREGTEAKLTVYDLIRPFPNRDGNFEETNYVLIVNEDGEKGSNYKIDSRRNIYKVFEKGGRYDEYEPLNQEEIVNDCLVACYPGLTIYEFNYDFVMGMRLLDPKTIATRLIQTLTSFRLEADFSASLTETIYEKRVSEIVANLIDQDSSEVSDCFYSFSNEKYQSMMQEAEYKRANNYSFQDGEESITINGEEIMDILNEYSSESTLHEQKDVLKRAFTQAQVKITDEVLPKDALNFDSENIRKTFVIEAVKLLTVVIFEVLISPKMLLLFEVNKRFMGEYNTIKINLKDLGNSLEKILAELMNLITSIIRELIETITAELLAFVMREFKKLLDKLKSMISLEQLNFYRELIMKLIKACSFSFPLFGHRANLDTDLDVVQYADIDEVEQPNTTEC